MAFSKRRILLIIFILLIIGFGAWLAFFLRSRPHAAPLTSNEEVPPSPSLIDTSALSTLATTHVAIDRSHLAPGVTPPTNKWFSGFALQKNPQPGFNYPNSFLPSSSGFEFNLPKVSSAPTIIAGPHTPDVVVSITGATSYKITHYDELTVELTYYRDKTALATVTLGSGLPYVYVTALANNTHFSFTGRAQSENAVTKIIGNAMVYGLNKATSHNSFNLGRNESATFFSAPSDSTFATVAKYAGAIVKSADVKYKKIGSNFMTTFTFNTKNNAPTLFARLPHQTSHNSPLATYHSILGDLLATSGTEFSYTTPAIETIDSLNLSQISTAQKNLIDSQLKKNLAQPPTPKPDTYFGGKQLYRTAQLLMIGSQLGDNASAQKAKTTLATHLESWLGQKSGGIRSFRYDPGMRGLVGNQASFGSDTEFNDHHFQYGYFIYAAAILAKYDSSFQSKYKNAVNLLVADIANYKTGEALPLRRNYDPYAGHSWASGTVPFKDGNNQESTSEALNAWTGVSLWAKQTNNQALGLEADWMLSNEYTTAQRYWLLHASHTPSYLGYYKSPQASIVWGGKREYATFFSNEPNAKLAIQLLPLSPTLKHVGMKLTPAQLSGTSTAGTYGDYILLATPQATIQQAESLPKSAIDDGDSLTYIYAYLLAK